LRKKSAARFWGLSRGWSAKKAQRIQWDTDFFPRGTGSSNPSPSSGESTANPVGLAPIEYQDATSIEQLQ
jgi:hypothetical protein